jgi:sodium transport system permease protein
VIAKVGAASLFGALAFAETLVGFGLVPVALPASRIGFSIQLDPWMLARTFALGIPMVLLASALMILLAARARTFRAAQTTLSLLMLLPSLPGMALGIASARPPDALLAVPFLGEQMIVTRLMRDEAVSGAQAALAGGATLAAAILVMALAIRTFERGQPLFDE